MGRDVDAQQAVDWSGASWLNPPAAVEHDGSDLVVSTRMRSDFWRTTSYGFVRDDGHALLAAFPQGSAVEVTFVADFEELYDQAGAMIRVCERNWIKAGIEMSDGVPQLGAVVTRELSDWSVAPVPDWNGRHVTVRVSRADDAVTVRARCESGPWRLVRLAPLEPDADALAGPFCCSPERGGLRVRFTRFTLGPADQSLHED
jgi:regulation of enolase protein 1 (concanavalin A-like superfamily)